MATHPWMLLNLYNVQCAATRNSEDSTAACWKNASIKFACVMESRLGPLRFNMIVEFHDGTTRFVNLMKMKCYKVDLESRPRVSLTFESLQFWIKTLKYRPSMKVSHILFDVKKVVEKQTHQKGQSTYFAGGNSTDSGKAATISEDHSVFYNDAVQFHQHAASSTLGKNDQSSVSRLASVRSDISVVSEANLEATPLLALASAKNMELPEQPSYQRKKSATSKDDMKSEEAGSVTTTHAPKRFKIPSWASRIHPASLPNKSVSAPRPDATGDLGSICFPGENSEILPPTSGSTPTILERLPHSRRSESDEAEAMNQDAEVCAPDRDASCLTVLVDFDESPSSSEYSSSY